MPMTSHRPILSPSSVKLTPTRLPALIVMAAAILYTPAALAAAPTFLHLEGSFSDIDTQACGFLIEIQQEFTADVQFFYDAGGNLDHSLNHIQLRGTDSANGISLADTADYTHTFDFTTGVDGDIGLPGHVRLPNGGTVAIEAGRVLTDPRGNLQFVAGKHQFLEGDLSAFCGALGG
jgi:hypothetical protein